jgi:hypothetical protein
MSSSLSFSVSGPSSGREGSGLVVLHRAGGEVRVRVRVRGEAEEKGR